MQPALSPGIETWSPRILSNAVGERPPSAAVVKENPVVVVGRPGCCMVHVIKRLLTVHGVDPTVCEVGDDADEVAALIVDGSVGSKGGNETMALPVVFIGGDLVGGLEKVMGAHISGELVTKLKDAGAIWL